MTASFFKPRVYAFRSLVFKFFSFVFYNFLFIFQLYFSVNFFFSSKIDEEFVVCLAIFLVFFLFINQIVQGIQDMLRIRSEIYINSFIVTFQLIRKALKRFKRHNNKVIMFSSFYLGLVENLFVSNLVSFYKHIMSINNYFLNSRIKSLIESLLFFYELEFSLKREFLNSSYQAEVKFESFLKNLV